MHIFVLRFLTSVFITIAFVLSLLYLQGLPTRAKQTFQFSLFLILIWSILELISPIFYPNFDQVILRGSFIFLNAGTFTLLLFHELESIQRWYDTFKIKVYVVIPGVSSGLILFSENISFTEVENSVRLLVLSQTIGIIEYAYVSFIAITVFRRMYLIYRASKFYVKSPSINTGFIIALIFVILFPPLLFYELLVQDLQVIPNIIGGIILLALVLIYSFIPISPIFHQQKLFSLYAISPGGMPIFRYQFTDPSEEFADLMVSGALYSSLTMIDDLYQGSNNINSIDLKDRFLTIEELNGMKIMLISQYQSKLLEIQLEQFVNNISKLEMLDEFQELRESIIPEIYQSMVDIFHTSEKYTDMSNFHVYPSYLE